MTLLRSRLRVPDPTEVTASENPALLSCRKVEVAYAGVQVLFGVDLEVHEGEIVALLGTNGAGKSTLLRAISGLVDPIGGAIRLAGEDITHAGPRRTMALGIAQVPGGRAIFPTLSVAEHFSLCRWNVPRREHDSVEARVDDVVQRFPILRTRWRQLAGNLSGGEAQQLGLAMALVVKPRLLVIDELTLGLAPTIVERLLEVVRSMNAAGTSVLLVEQSVNIALTLAERAYFLEKGEVRFEGKTQDLLDRDDILRAVFLEGSASVGGRRRPSRDRSTSGSSPAAVTGPPVLQVAGITKHFGGILALDSVTFDVRQSSILGLIGPNGAGKTTLFDILSGLLRADGGTIRLRGVNVTSWSPARRSRLGLARSFQDARLFPSLTVAENIAIGLERHVETRDHLAALLCLPAIQESEADVFFTVEMLVDMLNLGAYRDKFVSELSTGSRRVVELAMTVAHNPTVLILDEPSSGIAQREVEALGPLLERIRSETKCSMLVIEHDMPLITSIADEIVALDMGRVIARGTPSEVTADPVVVASYLGEDATPRSSGSPRAEEPASRLVVVEEVVTEEVPVQRHVQRWASSPSRKEWP